MAEDIRLQLSDIYEPVTEEQVQRAKNYVLRRESAARGLESHVDALLQDAAEKIMRICYGYNVDPETLELSYAYNEKMFREIADVMDETEEELLDLISMYAVRCTKDKDDRKALLIWILTLGRGNKSLKSTIEDRLRAFMRDVEAMVVAARKAGMDVSRASAVARNAIHDVYGMPGMKEVFAEPHAYKSLNIRAKGVKKGNRGNSNSEANNIIRMAKTTIQMAWMRQMRKNYEKEGAEAYYVLRGSTFPCDLCNSHVGIWDIRQTEHFPPFHPFCCCFAVPLHEMKINDLTL